MINQMVMPDGNAKDKTILASSLHTSVTTQISLANTGAFRCMDRDFHFVLLFKASCNIYPHRCLMNEIYKNR